VTQAEQHLWVRLKRHPFMAGWRHHVKHGRYELDFYAAPAQLCVEVDGYHH
jgi:very-short-patch-repair endonuclease